MAEIHPTPDSIYNNTIALKDFAVFFKEKKKGSVSNQSLHDIMVALAKPNRG
jgi:hypothetical protein